MRALSTIPNLRKLNLSRNKFSEFHSAELPENNEKMLQDEQIFPYLEELYFAFNQVPTEDKLFYPVMHIPSLKYLVITGNPFAVQTVAPSMGSAGIPNSQSGPSLEYTQTLQLLLDQKAGQLINEHMNPPAYLRRTANTRSTRVGTNSIGSRGTAGSSAFANMVNYGNSKALVQVNENRPGNPTDGVPPIKSAWGQTGTMLEGQPLAIEYNANVLEDRPAMPEMISEEYQTGETPHEDISKCEPASL